MTKEVWCFMGMPVKPTEKGASVAKDPFMVRCFKLAGIEESGVLIINQAMEVPASKVVGTDTQKTFRSYDNTGDDGNGDGIEDGGAMDADASGLVSNVKFLELLCLEEALQRMLMEAMMIKDVEPVPAKEDTSA
ncbi:hypothetical protein C0995_002801 [Termitomyces sp. Mi166|nr:hypothetical protein C0995_002801 [Termitomyces sp. Mi166\